MTGLSTHAKGLLITGLGVLIITPDGLLTRLIHTDPWTLTFWRSSLSCVGMMAVLLVLFRGRTFALCRAIGLGGLLIALLFGIGSVSFVLSVTSTTVANTLFVVSTSPLFAALIAWRLVGEPVPMRTWIAIGFALLGIGIIASESLRGGSWLGNGAALVAAVSLAASFTLIRRFQDRNMVPAMALSGVISALIALPLAQPTAISTSDATFLVLMGLIMLPLSFGLMFIGPRYIPAPEVGLVLLLEAIVGPFWVWLAVGEDPGQRTLIGGAIVIATLALNAALALRRARPPHVALPADSISP